MSQFFNCLTPMGNPHFIFTHIFNSGKVNSRLAWKNGNDVSYCIFPDEDGIGNSHP